jgi:hypothetical protein
MKSKITRGLFTLILSTISIGMLLWIASCQQLGLEKDKDNSSTMAIAALAANSSSSSYNVSLTYDGSNRLTSKIFRSGVILGSGTISADFYYSYTGTNTTYTSYSSWTGSTGSRIANTFDASGNILTTMSYTGLTQAQVQANSGGTLSTTTTSTYGRP